MADSLHTLALISLWVSAACAATVAIHVAMGHRQHMWIMNVVWVMTALYAGPLGLWCYFRWGMLSTHEAVMQARARHEKPPGSKMPFWKKVVIAATHCGAGCTVGDICAETFLIFVPLALFGKPIFAGWAIDYALAFGFGIAFQYFTIKPMRQLTPSQALWAALKADFLSITAWQVGMYGWMAIVTFAIFGHALSKTSPVFWFEMQIAMLCGLLTSYPVNWWLLRSGIKETM